MLLRPVPPTAGQTVPPPNGMHPRFGAPAPHACYAPQASYNSGGGRAAGTSHTMPDVQARVRFPRRFQAIKIGGRKYESPGVAPLGPRTPHPVFWVIAAALVVIATTLVLRSDNLPIGGVALGQPVTSAGGRGVFAFSGQMSKGSYGVYMVDVDAMTIWVYEYLPQKGCLRLAAARTWRYDRYLENHNICDLPPDIVEQMVDEQRQYRLQSSESQMP